MALSLINSGSNIFVSTDVPVKALPESNLSTKYFYIFRRGNKTEEHCARPLLLSLNASKYLIGSDRIV